MESKPKLQPSLMSILIDRAASFTEIHTNHKDELLDAIKSLFGDSADNVKIIRDYPKAYQRCRVPEEQLDNKEYEAIDEELKILAADVLTDIDNLMDEKDEKVKKLIHEGKKEEEIEEDDRVVTWKELEKIMESTTFAYPLTDLAHSVCKTDSRHFEDLVFTFGSGAADPKRKLEAIAMMKNLVGDAHAWDSLKIDTDRLASCFAESGATCDSLISALAAQEHVVIKAVDICVVRIPNGKTPQMTISRLQVYSARSCKRILAWNDNRNSLIGEFRSKTYEARSEKIKQIDSETKKLMNDSLKKKFTKA
jgi:hypothetical protein